MAHNVLRQLYRISCCGDTGICIDCSPIHWGSSAENKDLSSDQGSRGSMKTLEFEKLVFQGLENPGISGIFLFDKRKSSKSLHKA